METTIQLMRESARLTARLIWGLVGNTSEKTHPEGQAVCPGAPLP